MSNILVAMSGGVDSSAAAAILKEQGHTVAGATLRLWEPGRYFAAEGSDPVLAARRACDELGIPHYVFDCGEEFYREVVVPFCKAYEKGTTPNPCLNCNKALKFGLFLEKALEMGFDAMATGHYARIGKDEKTGRFALHTADSAKDQSYVLYRMDQRVLAHLVLPLYGMDKETVRGYARKAGISAFDSPDSQDVCFIPDKDYAAFLLREGVKAKPGNFTLADGTVLGPHKGLIHYTVGQRKGLGAFGSPKYVLSLNGDTGDVVLGENEDLFTRTVTCGEVNWISGEAPDTPQKAEVKIRYAARPAPATVYPDGSGAQVIFEEPQRAATPGQAAVFYRGDQLLGGGIIQR